MARRDRSRYFTLAHQYVSIAVYNGDLPRLDGSIACADCGQPAQEYDHRDYKKPLDVSPVCRVCNGLRGPGLHADPLETARKPPTRLARYWAEEERKARALKSRPDVFGPAPSSEPAKTEGA